MARSASQNAKLLKAKTRKKAKAAPAAKKPAVKKPVVKKPVVKKPEVKKPEVKKPMNIRAKTTVKEKVDHGKSTGIFGKKKQEVSESFTKSEVLTIQKASALLSKKGTGKVGKR